MKNHILVNYNIKINKIYKKGKDIFFFLGNNKYFIMLCKDDNGIKELYKVSNDLFLKGIKVNTFILTNKKECYSKWNDKVLVVIKENDLDNYISISRLSAFNINVDMRITNILDEWKNEIDVLENEIIEYNKEYALIQKSINYFIGMGENAIQLLSEIKDKISVLSNSVGHRVDEDLFKSYSLNNPLNFIKVNRSYDLSNYFKNMVFYNELEYDELNQVIKMFEESEVIYFFACLLYPNYYFSLVKKILLKKANEESLDLFISKTKEYLKMLGYCKKLVKNNRMIAFINWIDSQI